MLSIGSIASSIRKNFYDIFSRANTTGSLGTATDGSSWNAVNGTIQVTSKAAQATTTPTIITTTRVSGGTSGTTTVGVSSATGILVNQRVVHRYVPPDTYVTLINGTTITLSQAISGGNVTGTIWFVSANSADYPIAVQDMLDADVDVSLKNINEGSAIALWVQSSSDWWMVDIDGLQTTIPGNTNYGVTGYSPGSTYTAYNYFGTINWDTWGTSNYTSAGSNNYGATGSNATTYAYAEYLRVSKSVASVVNSVTSQLISSTASAASLFVSVVGNKITARAYSDSNLVVQIGTDLVYTATGATITTKYGIAISPSTYQQSAIIGTAININRN